MNIQESKENYKKKIIDIVYNINEEYLLKMIYDSLILITKEG